MENHICLRQTNYKWPGSIAMLNYQRVIHIENGKPMENQAVFWVGIWNDDMFV